MTGTKTCGKVGHQGVMMGDIGLLTSSGKSPQIGKHVYEDAIIETVGSIGLMIVMDRST